MSEHHPSCTPNDRSLIWLCAQCGVCESAEDILTERNAAEERCERLQGQLEFCLASLTYQKLGEKVLEIGQLQQRCERLLAASDALSDAYAKVAGERDQLQQRCELYLAALDVARKTIFALHGEIAWAEYLSSPEMTQIDAAIAAEQEGKP
jgi:hypothetical protein